MAAAYAATMAGLENVALAQNAPVEYIIIGSGPGGGPLAVNLARAGHKVVLFEAGSPATDLNNEIAIPLFNPLVCEEPEIAWNYYVRHYSDQTQQQKDSKYIPAGVPNSTNPRGGIYYPRCSTVGGCSTHNVLLMVYPSNSDFDNIATAFNDPTWSATNMRSYFQRLENCRYLIQAGSLHGTGGWQPIEMIDESLFMADPQLLEFMVTACNTMGKPGDFNRLSGGLLDPNSFVNASNDVQGLYSFPLMRLNGQRYGVREHVLQTAALLPNNLIIMTNCLVTKILFAADNQTATGVEYIQGSNLYHASPLANLSAPMPATQQMMASREVIVSCGTFNSPQLLKLSGIGTAAELGPLGIPVINNLPGVGLNMQDRYELGVLSQLKNFISYLAPCNPSLGTSDPCVDAFLAGLGPYTTNGTFISSILKSSIFAKERDLVLFFAAGFFRGYFPGWSLAAINPNNFNVVSSLMLRAHTNNKAGTVMLRSADPRDVPEINFHYFSEGTDQTGADLAACVQGLQLARNINAELGNIIEQELFPGPNYVGSDGLAEWAQNEAWGHHASCSNQMAPLANGGVVDNNFKVYGTNNLRVVDASVFMNIPGYYPMVPLLMISEKASDVVLAAAGNSQPAFREHR